MGDLALEWLDHILKGQERPALIADRVNYQVMGADVWKHAPSVGEMSNSRLRLYLDSDRLTLTQAEPGSDSYRKQIVDFADRGTQNNVFTPLIMNDEPAAANALVFRSEPFERVVELSGRIEGEFLITINKRDANITFALYEQLPDGRYFFLNRYLGRASYADDLSERSLLTPQEPTRVPFDRTKLTSRQLGEGSRLALVLAVNKHPFEQINYGTGGNVSDESIADAGVPLEILWRDGSYIDVPLWVD